MAASRKSTKATQTFDLDALLTSSTERTETEPGTCAGTFLDGSACPNKAGNGYPTCRSCADFYCRGCEVDVRVEFADFFLAVSAKVETLDDSTAQILMDRLHTALGSRKEEERGSVPANLYRTRNGRYTHLACVEEFVARKDAERRNARGVF